MINFKAMGIAFSNHRKGFEFTYSTGKHYL